MGTVHFYWLTECIQNPLASDGVIRLNALWIIPPRFGYPWLRGREAWGPIYTYDPATFGPDWVARRVAHTDLILQRRWYRKMERATVGLLSCSFKASGRRFVIRYPFPKRSSLQSSIQAGLDDVAALGGGFDRWQSADERPISGRLECVIGRFRQAGAEGEGLNQHWVFGADESLACAIRNRALELTQWVRSLDQFDGSAYWPAKDLISIKLFSDYNAVNAFLKKNPNVRNKNPKPRRLEIHVRDLMEALRQARSTGDHFPEEAVDAFVEGVEARKEASRRKKMASGQ